jgi:hypothetical protein
MRDWQTVFPNFKEKVIDRYSPDIFIHTWDDVGYWINSGTVSVHPESPKLDVTGVTTAYKPKMIAVEAQSKYSDIFQARASKFEVVKHKPQNIVSMYFSLYSGVNLVERYSTLFGVKYDLVIRLRPDMILHQDLPDLSPHKFYTIYHPSGYGKGTGDMFHAGSQENMSRFAKAGQMLEEVYADVGELCPHIVGQVVIQKLGLDHEELHIAKTLQHTPSGQYQDWK